MIKKRGNNGLALILSSLFVLFTLVFVFSFSFPSTGHFTKSGTFYNCTSCSDCTEAIADASTGDTILLNNSIDVGVTRGCINLTKNNVIFDCQNHVIRNLLNDSRSIGILLVYSNNTQIKNCEITKFAHGIYLSNSQNNILTNVNSSYNNFTGILLYYSSYNNFTNIITNNNYGGANIYNSFGGVVLYYSSNNTFTGIISNFNYNGINASSSFNNTFTDIITNNNYNHGMSFGFSSNYNHLINITSKENTKSGIFFFYSDNNTIINSHIENNSQAGIFLQDPSYTNLFYNNYINNTNNIFNNYGSINLNYFNITKTSGTNIIGKNYLGGNFWATPAGTGFSQKSCTNDSDQDYICDNIYNVSGASLDYLPLIYNTTNSANCTENWTCSVWGICNSTGTQIRTCIDLNSCGTIVNRSNLSQSCTPPPSGTGNWCYQETANVSTSCGGLSTGTYSWVGSNIVNPQNAYDENWNTFAYGSNSSESILYINYSKPTNSVSSSLWQIKNNVFGIMNLSIYGCWSYSSQLVVRIQITNTSANWTCQYGDGQWQPIIYLYNRSSSGYVYEEAMIWNISSGTSSNTDTTNTTTNNVVTPPSGESSGGSSGGSTVTITQNVSGGASPTKPAQINVQNPEIYLTRITINVLENVQNVAVSISKVDVDSGNIKVGAPSGQSYQAFKIETTGVNSTNIANVTIEFKVNKTWLASNNGSVENINLYRRPDSSNQWGSLATSFTREDSQYYYFAAISPGFSTFMVMMGGNNCHIGEEKCFDGKVQSCQNSEWTLVKECKYGCNNSKCKTFIESNFYFIVMFISLLMIIVGFFLFKKLKK